MAIAENISTLIDTVRAYSRWLRVAVSSRTRQRGQTNGNHLLLLASHLPPSFGAGVFRPLSFLNKAITRGWRVSAIAMAPREPPAEAGVRLAAKIDSAVRVRHMTPPGIRPAWNLFPRMDGSFLYALQAYLLGIGEYSATPPTVVMASGPNFDMFSAAWYLAKKFRAKLVLDYRDEWTQGTQEFIQLGNADAIWEPRCLRSADAVIFSTDGILETYLAAFPFLARDKCHVVRNGWNEAEFENVDKNLDGPKSEKLLISFIGTIGKHMRAAGFLQTLSKILDRRQDFREQVMVRFTGVNPAVAECEFEAFKQKYPDNIITESPRNREDIVDRISESTALLVLNETHRQRLIPLKLFESIGSGRPVLAYGDSGEVAKIMTDIQPGPMVPCDDADALELALEQLQTKPADFWHSPERDRWSADHRRDRLAGKLFDIMDALRG